MRYDARPLEALLSEPLIVLGSWVFTFNQTLLFMTEAWRRTDAIDLALREK